MISSGVEDIGGVIDAPHATVVDACNRAVINQATVSEMREAGVGLLGRTLLISSSDVFSPFGFPETLREIVRLWNDIAPFSSDFMMVRSLDDMRQAALSDAIGVYLYLQSPEPIANQLWRLELLSALGVRVLQLTYNQRSLAGDGCAEKGDAGLSEFGERLISTCERLGVTVDVSHSWTRTSREAIEVASGPIVMTHTGAKAIHDHVRCKRDEELQACAKKGGVIGIAGAMASLIGEGKPTVETVVDHIEYIAHLVGIDHVGLGFDFISGHERDDFSLLEYKSSMYQEEFNTGISRKVEGLESIRGILNLRTRLLARGFSEDDCSRVFGSNFRRVFEETWVARTSAAGRE